MFDERSDRDPTNSASTSSRFAATSAVPGAAGVLPRAALLHHITSLSDDALDTESTRLAALLSAAQAELAAVLAEIERRDLHGSWDCRSVERYATMRCQLSRSRADSLGVLGRALHDLPTLGAAVVAGELAVDKAVMIARVASPASEVALVELAMHASVEQTRRICSEWRRIGAEMTDHGDGQTRSDLESGPEADADAAAARALDGAALGRVIVIHDDEGVELRARFDHVAGAFVLAALDRAAAEVRTQRRDAAPIDDPSIIDRSSARPASVDEVPRERLSAEQWRAQGLLHLIERAPTTAPRTITRSGFVGEVVVHVPIDALLDPTDVDDLVPIRAHDQHDRAAGPSGPASPSRPPDPRPPDPRLDITRVSAPRSDGASLQPRGIRLRRDAARHLVCDGGIHTVLTDTNGDPLHLGRRVASITPAQRRAVHARHQHCTWPGCTGMVVQLHHRHHRVVGGHDDIENLVPLCTHHHGVVHRRSITIGRSVDGALHFVRASGTTITVDHPFGREPIPHAPIHPGRSIASLRDRQRALGIDLDAPLREPQWRNDRFDLGDCIAAVLSRRDAALRRTQPT